MRSETQIPSGVEHFDVVVIGGGHNALVAAAYLARAGRSVCVLEQADHVGGAAVSDAAFAGVDARLSRYSYLVSLFPDEIARDLGVRVPIVSREIASYTPVRLPDGAGGRDAGLLVERREGPATAASFRDVTGSHRAYAQWQEFYGAVASYAKAIAPTFLEPLPTASEMRDRVGVAGWQRFVDQPLAATVEAAFTDDLVRGIVLTDGLIGTFTSAADPARAANRCFLYHVAGNGTGEWRVPVGGMGALTTALADAARQHGAVLRTTARATAIVSDGSRAEVTYTTTAQEGAQPEGEEPESAERVIASTWVLCGAAPTVLDALLGAPSEAAAEGAQLKINMVVSRLPRLRSGVDPRLAFAGTLHIDEGCAALESAYAQAVAGTLPDPLPAEIYCHTLTDPTILGPELAASGAHTLTVFGLHVPERLFTRATNDERRERALDLAVQGLDTYLAEPLADCLLTDASGRPCIEAVTPLDLERSVGLPRGNIFHGELSWPWADGSPAPAAQPGSWGVETRLPNVLVCGAGARRGGGVSGIGGHNAAMAVLGRP